MKTFLILSLLVIPVLFGSLLRAADFNPATPTDFQTALNQAASNGDTTNTITLNVGSYSTPFNGFRYSSTNSSALVIQGAGMGKTVLDGGTINPGLVLSSNSASSVEVSGLTVVNCRHRTGVVSQSPGLEISGNDGPITVDHVELR